MTIHRVEVGQVDSAAFLDALADMAFLLDAGGNVMFANEACRAAFEPGPESDARNALAFVHPDDRAMVAASLTTIRPNAVGNPIELRVAHMSGDWRWVDLIISNRQGAPGLDGFVCVARDISDRSMWEAAAQDVSDVQFLRRELDHRAQHDALTGLANRELLESTIDDLLGADEPFALLFVDVDGLEDVEDRFGHQFRDRLLEAVAQRLSLATRAGDLVARVGSDEFVIVAREFDHLASAARFGDRLVRAFEEPFIAPDCRVSVGARIGIALSRDGTSFEQLRDAAESNMHDQMHDRAGREHL